jgi:hypothetical protein
METWRIKELTHTGIGRIAYAEDGLHLVTSSADQTQIWDTRKYTTKNALNWMSLCGQ